MPKNKPNMTYRECLERLKIEFSDFIRTAEISTNRSGLLSARKSSVQLRRRLLEFRRISLVRDKEIKEMKQNLDKEIKNSFA